MRRLLRKRETGEYLRPDGTWTEDPSSAFDFPNTLELVRRAIEMGDGFEQVLMLGDQPSGLDVAIPLERSRVTS